jgi:hypothetical protein
MRNFRTAWPVVLGLGLVCILLFVGTAGATVSGAIFTTTSGGLTVNGNIYSSLADVYLNGGPQNGSCSPASAGLTPGTYYFQVTDPSGSTLLSTDPASDRIVTIGTDGLLDGYTGPHSVNTGKCVPPAGTDAYNISVALCWNGTTILCNNTTNPGGEYKAWLIATNAATVNADLISLTFSSSAAKTDNFKAPPFTPGCPGGDGCPSPPPATVNLTGNKFYDTNANGVQNNGEVAIPNWLIEMSPASNFDVSTQSAGSGATCDLTGTNGVFGFTVLPDVPLTYTFSEAHPVVVNGTIYVADPVWHQTAPIPPGTGTETDSSAGTQTPVSFGNVCTGAGGGLTLGFWSNNNGDKVLTGSTHGSTITNSSPTFYSALINGSYLRNTAGANLNNTFTSFSGFSSYLLNGNATNMAYMLSVQYIAMALNVDTGNVVGGTLVYCPACTGANASGFISTNGLLAEVESQLAHCGTGALVLSPCVVGSSSSLRTYWQGLETALDNANNNKTFVQPTACSFTFDPTLVNTTCVF